MSNPAANAPIQSLHADDPQSGASPTPLSDRINKALQGIQHGQLTIVVHDGQVVQIDRTIKVRHFRSARRSGSGNQATSSR